MICAENVLKVFYSVVLALTERQLHTFSEKVTKHIVKTMGINHLMDKLFDPITIC